MHLLLASLDKFCNCVGGFRSGFTSGLYVEGVGESISSFTMRCS